MAAVDGGEQVALLDLRRLPGAGAAALHVDDDERDLGHHRQPDAFLLERVARARGDGHRAAAGVAGADGEGAGGDLVLGLVHEAADLLEALAQVVRGRGRRRDRVHGADVHARGQHAQRDGGVAADHHLRLGHGLGRDAVLEVQRALGPVEAGLHEAHVGLDDLARPSCRRCSAICARASVEVEAVDAAQRAEHEHVLAAPRVGHQRAALAFQRHFDDAIAVGEQRLHRLEVRGDDLRVLVLAPDALEHDRRAGLQLAGAHASEQHLLVEGHHQVGLVAAVGDAAGADADADAAGPGHAARRRLDLGRDDLDRPDAVAAARGDGGEALAAALRAFAGIADDLDDVLGQVPGRLRCWRGSRAGRAGRCRSCWLVSSVVVQPRRTRAGPCSARWMPNKVSAASPS